MAAITTVWIDAGCIGCTACSNDHPTIFAQPEEKAQVLGSVRIDGLTSDNDVEKSTPSAQGLLQREEILEAVAGCPVDAIRVSPSR